MGKKSRRVNRAKNKVLNKETPKEEDQPNNNPETSTDTAKSKTNVEGRDNQNPAATSIPPDLLPECREQLKMGVSEYLQNKNCLTKKWVKSTMPTIYSLIRKGTLTSTDFVLYIRDEILDRPESKNIDQPITCWNLLLKDAFFIAGQAIDGLCSESESVASNLGLELAMAIYKYLLVEERRAIEIDLEVLAHDECAVMMEMSNNNAGEELAVFRNTDGWNHVRAERCFAFGHMMTVAKRIEYNPDPVHKICWGCKQRAQALHACTKCQVVQYCGKACQLQDWNSGHESECPDMKMENRQYQKELSIVTNHHDAEISRNMTPAFSIDFELLMMCISVDSNNWLDPRFERQLGRKSMENFYSNMDLIQEGKIWFFKSSDAEQPMDGKEVYIMCTIFLRLLLYDYVGYMRRNKIAMAKFASTFSFLSTVPAQKFGIHMSKMTSSRFIHFYNYFRGIEGHDMTAFREKWKRRASNEFLEELWVDEDDDKSEGKEASVG